MFHKLLDWFHGIQPLHTLKRYGYPSTIQCGVGKGVLDSTVIASGSQESSR